MRKEDHHDYSPTIYGHRESPERSNVMIKYIGSKRLLVPELVNIVTHFPRLRSFTDLFSGTSRVGHAMKLKGLRVTANDVTAYAHTLAVCYVESDYERVGRQAKRLISELARTRGKPGYFTDTFCVRSRFFRPENGEKIDAIREAIEAKGLEPQLKAIALTSLMEAADRVDSTCGLQMAYVKRWAHRAYNTLELRMPAVAKASSPNSCKATQLDARDAAACIDTDIVYLDPPYNQHSYLSNYHIWESLVLWDKPEHYGVACKRVDCRTRKSSFNSKVAHKEAFATVVKHAARNASLVIASFSDEGYQTHEELSHLLAQYGELHVIRHDYKRYVGAQIGIYNPSGEVTGEVSHTRNTESIYILATDADPSKTAHARKGLVNLMRSLQIQSGMQIQLQ